MSEIDGFSSAVQSTGAPDYDPKEIADVKNWQKKIGEAREFDKNQRKRYALDRKSARGDSGQFEVSIPIAGTYVDILKSFLYARDPDLDIQPAPSTQPPPMANVMEMARQQVMADPQAQQAMQLVGQQAAASAAQANTQATLVGVGQALEHGIPKTSPPQPTVPPDQAAQAAVQGWIESTVRETAQKILAPYHKRLDDAKQFGKTLEIIISAAWKKAKLKTKAKPCVGSCLTNGIGWLKATWQEQSGQDPLVVSKINSLQENLAKLAADSEDLAEGEGDKDQLQADIEQQIAGLQAHVEVMIARGLAIDSVAAEDIQVAPGVPLTQYVDSPWIAHRMFMSKDDAKAKFKDIEDELDHATLYQQRKPADPTVRHDAGSVARVQAEDADQFTSASGGDSTGGFVCVWEIWCKDNNNIITVIDGVKCYAVKPYTPNPGTSRFYSFFAVTMLEVDGERHPQSMIQRTQHLLDDMNRLYSNRAEHRRRSIPKLAFDATTMDVNEVKKLEAGGIGELVPLKPTEPGMKISEALHPVAYAQIDPALYDDRPTRAMLEMAWGIQEALAASVQTAKTATEAEIQQTGTNARTSYMRDALDSMFDELALYSAEVLLQKYQHQDAMDIAGPWAFWPNSMSIEDMSILLTVSVKGGSSGKPDTTAQQQSWAALFPILQNAITTVGQLRQSSPGDIADGIEELVIESLNRSGDRLDATRFLPPPPSAEPGPMPAIPQAPMAPQPAIAGTPNPPTIPMPPTRGGPNLAPVPHNGLIGGHRV